MKEFIPESKTLLLFIWWCWFATGGLTVEITRLSIPRFVENGTVDSIILDCEYNYSEKDTQLVIKWFLNDDPEPIYQWIPELHKRHASWRLLGRLNMDYSITPSSEATKYRALNILRPTTELSGRYSCLVMSLASQDSKDGLMIVYAPPRRFQFNYTKVSRDEVTFVCEADGAFPRPELTLYRLNIDGNDPEMITDVETFQRGNRHAPNVKIVRTFQDREFNTEGPVILECVLHIPRTDYSLRWRLTYYPDLGVNDAECLVSWRLFVLNLVIFMIFRGSHRV